MKKIPSKWNEHDGIVGTTAEFSKRSPGDLQRNRRRRPDPGRTPGKLDHQTAAAARPRPDSSRSPCQR